jgi:hypothetical protein
MKIEDINGLTDLLKLGGTLETIVESLRDNLSEEDKKKFDEEIEKSNYKKVLRDAKGLKIDVSEALKNYK